jgi:uncharacterized protein involved in exopolysaccharide biosynthesis
MAETFDVFRYMSYLRLRWRWIAATCAIAVTLAVGVTLALPKQYTATVRIVVEPPAGTDLRSAMAVSPIYLESLRTYEHFASSDSLFRDAIDKLGLRQSLKSQPIESLKKRVLEITIVRNTRILEISATLPDPRKAHALAQFIAEATVNLTRSMVSEGDRDLVRGIERQQSETRSRLQEVEEAWAKVLASEPVADLKAAMESAADLRAGIERRAALAQLDLADAAEREKHAQGAELAEVRREASDIRARLNQMRKQIGAIDREEAQREKLLALRMARRDRLESDRKARQAELAAIESRLREARAESGYRGERLKIIDPGIVPERPSSPNLPLAILAALLVGLILPVLYLTLEMNYQARRVTGRHSVYRE